MISPLNDSASPNPKKTLFYARGNAVGVTHTHTVQAKQRHKRAWRHTLRFTKPQKKKKEVQVVERIRTCFGFSSFSFFYSSACLLRRVRLQLFVVLFFDRSTKLWKLEVNTESRLLKRVKQRKKKKEEMRYFKKKKNVKSDLSHMYNAIDGP